MTRDDILDYVRNNVDDYVRKVRARGFAIEGVCCEFDVDDNVIVVTWDVNESLAAQRINVPIDSVMQSLMANHDRR
jgi:hypothetical protein